jgi:hypothetical protein
MPANRIIPDDRIRQQAGSYSHGLNFMGQLWLNPGSC